MDLGYSIIYVIVTFIIGGFVALWLPGIEKKAEARVQQRIGPQLSSPGVYTTLKFFFKHALKPTAVMPRLYNALPIITLVVVAALFLISCGKKKAAQEEEVTETQEILPSSSETQKIPVQS